MKIFSCASQEDISVYTLDYRNTIFLKSASKIIDIQIKNGIEIAFVGYSNSGKSSAINSLTGQKKLARFSKTPGRTQLINFFEVSSGFRIVDLPGYGYSKSSISVKLHWQKILYNYLEKRNLLKGIVLLMDIRYPLKILDHKIIDLAVQKKISLLILLTKCDKITLNQQKIQYHIIEKKLHTLIDFFEIAFFSSVTKMGLLKLQNTLNYWYHKYNH